MQRREKRKCNATEEAYIETYAGELAGTNTYDNTIVDRKHAGLAIIAFFSNPENGWQLNIIRRQFLNGLAKNAEKMPFRAISF